MAKLYLVVRTASNLVPLVASCLRPAADSVVVLPPVEVVPVVVPLVVVVLVELLVLPALVLPLADTSVVNPLFIPVI